MTNVETPTTDDLVEVTVLGVEQADPTRNFIVLKEKDGDRRLPVFIGPSEPLPSPSRCRAEPRCGR